MSTPRVTKPSGDVKSRLRAIPHELAVRLAGLRTTRSRRFACGGGAGGTKPVDKLLVAFLSGGFTKLSSAPIPIVIDRRAALVKPQRHSFADLHVASQST